ncbi:hypothetical protein HY411_00860 [Candidatus Gottesmanbacteria bacterium]|nr:hypothetical protein [Candidatus Gottesmanbacteria bacterium]
MNEEAEPPVQSDEITTTEPTKLLGETGHLGDSLTFQTAAREPLSNMPSISSVWRADLVAKAQKVADERGVPLQTIVQEWEAVWAANG